MSQLERIKKYAELLGDAAKWHPSGEQILDIEAIPNKEKKSEYIYEFYCLLRVVDDLTECFDIEITNTSKNTVFPKAPASKKNFPFFQAKRKGEKEVLFDICAGIDVIGKAGETSAPDISFQIPKSDLKPTFEEVILFCDSKFKHELSTNVHEGEFTKVASMVINLGCIDPKKHGLIKYSKLQNILGNCLLTNTSAFKRNHEHQKLFGFKTIEKFDVGSDYIVIG